MNLPDFSTLPSHIWCDHILPQTQFSDLYNVATISPLFHEYFMRSTKLSRKQFKYWLEPVLSRQTKISYIYLPIYGILLLDRRNKPLPRETIKMMLSKLSEEQIKILHNLAVSKLRQEAGEIVEYRVRILSILHNKFKAVTESKDFEYIKCDSAVFGLLGLKSGCNLDRVVVLGMDSYCFDNTSKMVDYVYKKYVDYSKTGKISDLFEKAGFSKRKVRKIVISNVDFDGSFRDKSVTKLVNRYRIKSFSKDKCIRKNPIEAVGSCNETEYLLQKDGDGIGDLLKTMFPKAKLVGLIKLGIRELYGRYLKAGNDDMSE